MTRTVDLREIVTNAERAAARSIERGPGQDRFVATGDVVDDEAVLRLDRRAR